MGCHTIVRVSHHWSCPTKWLPSQGCALLRFIMWDDAAVRRAAKDNNALVYGFLIVAAATAIPFILLPVRNAQLGYPAPWALVGTRYALTLTYSLVWIVLQIRLSHVLAKMLFDAKGSYIEIMRPYMLGQLYRCLIVVPVLGAALAGLGGIAVLMMVFEEVDDIEGMKAFGLAAAIGITFWLAGIWIATSGPHPMR
jgi:hypothetical protein